MKTNTTFTRREISVQAALLLLGGATITLNGCSSGSASPGSTPTPTPTADKNATNISGNHGHSAVITGAQLTAGGGLSLNIQGASAHNHVFDLTGAEVVQIRNGATLTRTSAVGSGHTHDVTFN